MCHAFKFDTHPFRWWQAQGNSILDTHPKWMQLHTALDDTYLTGKADRV